MTDQLREKLPKLAAMMEGAEHEVLTLNSGSQAGTTFSSIIELRGPQRTTDVSHNAPARDGAWNDLHDIGICQWYNAVMAEHDSGSRTIGSRL